jgi:hypothetical protein
MNMTKWSFRTGAALHAQSCNSPGVIPDGPAQRVRSGIHLDLASKGKWTPGLRAGISLVGLFALAVLAGCSGKPAQQEASDTPHNVTLTKAQQGSIHIATVASTQYHTAITTTGVVDFDHDRATDILAPFSGAVTKVLVTQGQHVTRFRHGCRYLPADGAGGQGGGCRRRQ